MPGTRTELRWEERESVLERGDAIPAPLLGGEGRMRDESEASWDGCWSAILRSMQVGDAKERSGGGRGGWPVWANQGGPIRDIISMEKDADGKESVVAWN